MASCEERCNVSISTNLSQLTAFQLTSLDIPAIDEGSSVSSQTKPLDNNQSGSGNNPVSSQTKPLDNNQGGSEKNLDAILHAITLLGERIKHLEAVPPILQEADQLDDNSDEDSAEDSTGKHWGMSTIKEIRRHYEVGDRLADGDVLSFVSAKTLRRYQTNDALLNRVQSLMARFESVIHNHRTYPRLQEIQSKGLQKMMEMLHLKSRLLHFALSHPMNVANIIEITELVYLLCEVEKIFLEEGLFDSNFEVATNFIQPFVQSNTFADITEKARSKKREKAVIKTAFVGKIQKPNKMKEKLNKPYTSQHNSYSKSYKSNSNFQKSGDSKPKYNNNNSGGSFSKDL
ncbi:predicted protein [Naegleria gruberi]|uniref:Predicted protein n=1 Tax=Naegleria gruberi TaxID=5762 RepID=D2VQX4_NAEGR|nr:uncharacterized protein NAEGRDRAFT_71379 [Naegleria gruberi]EFC40712.1 predicted protein [Naegleria gruberi]|eukprot:XP_002673456.1 predicted protein [Naegleria gruberi strain NEG-M]